MGRVYSLAAWQRARRLKLDVDPLCEICKKRGILRPAKDVDHIVGIAAGGDWFDGSNLMSMCHECHAAKTRKEYGAAVNLGTGVDGVPIDDDHPWNKR